MPLIKPKKELADGMIFSVYPSERAELERVQEKLGLKSPFDVVRKALRESRVVSLKAIREPRPVS